MAKHLTQPDQRILTPVPGHRIDPFGEGLPEAMRGEAFDGEPVLDPDALEHHIEPVGGVGLANLGEEYRLVQLLDAELIVAGLDDGTLEGVIDLDDAPLPGLLLVDDEGILVKKLVPSQPEKVADAEAEEDAAAHEEADAIVPVLEEPVHQGDCLVPVKRFSRCVCSFCAHCL